MERSMNSDLLTKKPVNKQLKSAKTMRTKSLAIHRRQKHHMNQTKNPPSSRGERVNKETCSQIETSFTKFIRKLLKRLNFCVKKKTLFTK